MRSTSATRAEWPPIGAIGGAERALTVVQLARTAVDVAGGAARMFAELGPWAFPAVAAMLGVMASLGFSGGGSAGKLPETNQGTGSVLGDSSAKSESITRAIEQLADIDKVTMTHSAGMLATLRSIDGKIGGLASLIVRTGDVDASSGIATGFKADAAGSILGAIPLIGGALKSLFGTTTKVIASGISATQQTLADVMSSGFDASYYSDVEKKKKLFGLTTSTKFSTSTTGASGEIEQQFTQILTGFYDVIGAAAGPLRLATGTIEDRLNGFVVNIGKIDLQGLTGEEISEKLSAVFGKAADDMARAAVPGLEQFQKVGEGLFETLVRVSTTMETVSTSLGRLGANAQGLDMATSVGIAGMFGSLSDMVSASDAYFDRYFSDAEKVAQRTADMGRAFDALGLAMPGTTEAFRALVEAQDLTTAAGQQTYATLLQIAPAFAELHPAMEAVSEATSDAAAILRERMDLERQLLTLEGNTAELRRRDLASIAEANRPLQERIWAIQDERAATEAATQAAQAVQAHDAHVGRDVGAVPDANASRPGRDRHAGGDARLSGTLVPKRLDVQHGGLSPKKKPRCSAGLRGCRVGTGAGCDRLRRPFARRARRGRACACASPPDRAAVR